MKSIRKIIEIDAELCNGCGQCIPGCMEGAIAIIDGKARLVKDSYCDGLGACLGHCPTGALAIVEREADDFDEAAAMVYVASQGKDIPHGHHLRQAWANGIKTAGPGGCPGAAITDLRQCPSNQANPANRADQHSDRQTFGSAPANFAAAPNRASATWPLKIRLAPAGAPFFKDADILVAADCAAAASPAFHSKYAPGKVLLIGCPKFDNTDDYLPKLAEIFSKAGLRSCTVLRMGVPCCRGLSMVVDEAARLSGSRVPVRHIILSRGGEEAEETVRTRPTVAI